MSTPTPALRTEGLTKRFQTTVAVQDLSLVVPPGEVFGFLGPNGAGKSTTVRMLLGLLRPTGGTAEIFGVPVADVERAHRHLAYVPELTVRHLPQPAGRDRRARHRMEARNRLLTAVLRRPPAVVARTAAAAWRTDPGAVADAARLLPWALRERRRLPAEVESAVAALEG